MTCSVWNCKGAPYHPWVWRRILKVRDLIYPHISQGSTGTLLWQGSEMEKYSVTRVWQAIRVREEEVRWHRLIWKGPSIPKYSFIMSV
ncbi:hypothetical protein LINGRAHAP2_LOCUS32312 [Linum grandiflorum]